MIEILKALADENRLRLFNLLALDEFCVCEIEVFLNMSQSNVSRHLSKLKSSGIIMSKKEAQWVHYRVSSQFREKYPGLVSDILKSLALKPIIQEDKERVDQYKKQGLDCQMVTSDREMVITKINSLI